MCTGKCSCKTKSSKGPAVAANNLLIENENLHAKLEDQEAELTEAIQQIMSINRLGKDTKAELEDFKKQYVSMEMIQFPPKMDKN